MSTEREQLELAAKACGLPECGWMGPAFMYVKNNTFTDWNPRTDDGDALRLAVKLNLTVRVCKIHGDVLVESMQIPATIVEFGNDPYAATRRAIVLAAAEIGRTM